MANDKIDDDVTFSIIVQIRKHNNRAQVDNIYIQIIKTVNLENITKEFLDDRIHTLITEGKIIYKVNRNADSYYVHEKKKRKLTHNLQLQNTSPITPYKSFYIPTIYIQIPSIKNQLISHNKTPVTEKSTNLSPDHQTTSQNFT